MASVNPSNPLGFGFTPTSPYQAPQGVYGMPAGGGGGGSRVGRPGVPDNYYGGGSGGFPGGGMTLGSHGAQMQAGMAGAMGPLWKQGQMLPHVGQAYDMASQMLGPGFPQGGGATPWGGMLQQLLGSRMGAEHPGMPDEQWRQGLQSISGAAEGEKAKAMSLLGSTGGGSVDPRAASAALSRISGGVPSAVANLAAQRSGLDLQAMLGMGGIMQPLGRQELVNQGQMQSQYGSELRGLAGNILGGGVYGAGGGGARAGNAGGGGRGFMGLPMTRTTMYGGR
jgi:hypothetical protein